MNVVIEERSAPSDNYGYAKAVLAAMQEMTAKGIEDAKVKAIAKKLQGASDLDTLRNDWTYLKRRIRYAPDPPDKERITSARFTIGHGVPEDCDGLSVAAASLFALQDIPATFAAIAWRKPEFSHVYVTTRVSDREIPFDLTLPELGQQHKYHTILKAPTMPTIQTISDAGTMTMSQVYRNLYSTDPALQREAYMIFYKKYPKKAVAWLQAQAQALALSHSRGISDYFADPLSNILSGVAGVAAGIGISLLTGGAGAAVAPGAGAAVASAVNSGASSTPKDADPNRPGRSVHDARTWMDELPDIYPSGRTPRGNPTASNNWSIIIHVPASQVPKLDQNIVGTFPGLIFLSMDDQTSWVSDWSTMTATPVGNGYSISFVRYNGTADSAVGYYVRTPFSDGAVRFDFVGLSPSDIPGTAEKTAVAQTQNSTSVSSDAGNPLPTKKVNTAGATGGVTVPTGGGSDTGGGGGKVTVPVDTTVSTPYGNITVPKGTTIDMPKTGSGGGAPGGMKMNNAMLIGGGVVAVGLVLAVVAMKK